MIDLLAESITDRICPARNCGILLAEDDDGNHVCTYHGVQPEPEYLDRNDPPEGEQVQLGQAVAADGGDAA